MIFQDYILSFQFLSLIYAISLQRKSQNVLNSTQNNFFDSLASASTAIPRKTSDCTIDWKKMRREVV